MSGPRLAALAPLLALTLAAPTIAQAQQPQGPPAPPLPVGPGVIKDREGAAARRGSGEARWGAVEERDRLRPGDWIKTGSRGANALAVTLGNGAELVLGPGALVEVSDGAAITIHAGDVEVAPKAGAKVTVTGPQGSGPQGPGLDGKRELTERAALRVKDRKLQVLTEDPRWLAGYRANASTEAVGSLLATVDGRNVPLTLGYHSVTVEVRDQIARTTIEERFVNRTGTILEGVFYFPLPSDASISGFGMWIGDELVHGEIVEKERARAIYETILREKRDPGLLEWAGGSVFKARVYPIGAEKRIQIVYTQVLKQTRRADGACVLRYTHPLQSEMLRATPLERLEVRCTVSSERALVSFRSPSHAGRLEQTDHAAAFELSQEQVSPDRDLELEIITKAPAGAGPGGGGVTAITHRRADDGYLMLLLDAPTTAPAAAPGGVVHPLDLVIVADTSGSLLGPARAAQVAFVSALLDALSEKDTINLVTCDAQARWAFERAQPCTSAARESLLGALESRAPLGWSDLDLGFQQVAGRVGQTTHVIYVGDGAITTGDGDAAAFARRLTSLYPGRGTFHAVVPGTTAEPIALRAIAAQGGGSLRTLDGSDPSRGAFELLAELTAPVVKDLALRFEGIEVAAIHPQPLPNLPLGAQHVVVGRWDPRTAGTGKGRVVLTGTIGGQRFESAAEVSLPQVEAGNSFVPRLWAKGHLDHLLAEGVSAETKKRVIALSEDFQVVTPYTSFLVLESDADRVRFEVKKTTRMRDGEEFFAEGNARAAHELARAQAQRAKRWRLELQARAVAALVDLNRALTMRIGTPYQETYALAVGGLGRAQMRAELAMDGGGGGGGGTRGAPSPAMAPAPPGEPTPEAPSEASDDLGDADDGDASGEPSEPEADAPAEEEREGKQDQAPSARAPMPVQQPGRQRAAANEMMAEKSISRDRRGGRGGWMPAPAPGLFMGDGSGLVGARPSPVVVVEGVGSPWDGLFVGPGGPRAADAAATWSGSVTEALAALDRRARVVAGPGGLSIVTRVEGRDGRGRPRDLGEARWVIGKDAWCTGTLHLDGQDATVEWLEAGKRGAFGLGWRLGRERAAVAGDERAFAAPFGWAWGDEARSLAGWDASVAPREGGGTTITFTARTGGVTPLQRKANERLVTVDIDARGVVIASRLIVGGKVVGTTTWSEHVEVAGLLWPKVETVTDADGKVQRVTRIAVEALAPAALPAALQQALAARQDAVHLGAPPASLEVARRAVADGKARLEDRWALLGAMASEQRWDEAAPHADAVEQALAGKPGLAPVRATRLLAARRLEELKAHLDLVARDVAKAARPADLSTAQNIIGWSQSLGGGQEQLALLELLRPTIERRGAAAPDLRAWHGFQVAQAQGQLGREKDALATLQALRAALPEQANVHHQLANHLHSRGDVDAALAVLDEALAKNGPWPLEERRQLERTALDMLWMAQRFEALVARLERLEREAPDAQDASLLGRRLTALVMLDREDAAWTLVQEWTKTLPAPDAEVTALAHARIQASIAHALGQSEGLWTNQVEEERAVFALELARRLVLHPGLFHHAQGILGHWQVVQTDAGRALARDLFARLRAEVTTLEPTSLQQLVNVCMQTRGVAADATLETDAAWRAIFEAIYARWERAAGPEAADPLAALLDSYAGPEVHIRRLRLVHARLRDGGEPAAVRDAARALLGALLGDAWSAERLGEVRTLLSGVGPLASEAGLEAAVSAAVDGWVVTFMQFVDWSTTSRAEAVVAARPDVNTLPRRKLAAARAEALREARAAALADLADLLACKDLEGLETLGGLEPWVLAEQAWLRAKLRVERDQAQAWAGATLGRLAGARAEAQTEPSGRDRILAARALATAIALLAEDLRAGAATPPDEATAARTAQELATLASTIGAQVKRDDRLVDWREAELVLRLLTEDLAALEVELTGWVGAAASADATPVAITEAHRWARPLAWILAERDALDRAVAVLADLDRRGAAAHGDLRLLVDWHTALDHRELADQARLRSWELADEWTIAQALQADFQKVQRRGEGVPEPLDPEAPVRVTALFKKAQHPQQHAWVVQQLYQTTRDFRLLGGLADACVGQSVERTYNLLEGFRQVTESLQEEATLDQLVARIAETQKRARTDVDRRALKLLEFSARRRSAEQRQGSGPHLQAALTALKEAWKGSWQEGEPQVLARFLVAQGQLAPALADEQVRQVVELVGMAKVGSDERLDLSLALSQLQWTYGKREDAVRTLGAAVEATRQVSGGAVPPARWSAVEQLVSYLQSLGDWRGAERHLEVELAAQAPQQHLWNVGQRRLTLWIAALASNAEVSLGRGKRLYEAVRDQLLRGLAQRTNEGQAGQAVSTLVSLAQTGCRAREVGAQAWDDLKAFGFTELPRVLGTYQHRNGSNMAMQVASGLENVGAQLGRHAQGCAAALELLIVRAESEPRWLRLHRQDLWSQAAWQFANLRARAGALPAGLSERLLALAIRGLQAELRQPWGGYQPMTYRHSSEFWAEKAPDFARAARAVLAERPRSEQIAIRVAQYLHDGLGLEDEAITLLAERAAAGALRLEGRALLAQWLVARERWKEAAPVLEVLIREQPADMNHRRLFMLASHALDQQDAVRRTRKEAEAVLRELKAWDEGAIAVLAQACVECALHEDAVALWKEAIELHVKAQPDTRGNGDGQLASYYLQLAAGLAGLQRTDEAVDAACGAIVAWGRSVEQRAMALDGLKQLLAGAKDLQAYGARLDAQVQKDGLENPTLRKALGEVWLDKGQAAEAERHLARALEAAPNDADAARLLVRALDQQDRGAEAATRLLSVALSNGHDVGLFKDLAARFERLGQKEEAERAWTMIVEVLPEEAESHQALAEQRERQDRMADAVVQWRHVVRVRSDEPSGWLGLGKALARAGQRDEAAEVVKKLRSTSWDGRFGDQSQAIGELERMTRGR